MCSAVYGTVHYKEPLKSFEKSRALSRVRLPSVASLEPQPDRMSVTAPYTEKVRRSGQLLFRLPSVVD